MAPSTLDAARCLHGTGVAKLHHDAVITCQNIRATRGTVVADESFYELWKQNLDEDNSITIVWDNEATQTKRKVLTSLADLPTKSYHHQIAKGTGTSF